MRSLALLFMVALLAACGVKRPLTLPGQEPARDNKTGIFGS